MGTLTVSRTRARRAVVLVLAGLLAAGGLASPARAASPSIRLSASAVIGGEAVTISGSIRERGHRTVRLQRRSGRAWITVQRKRTSARGRFTFRYRPAFAAGPAERVRVYAPGGRGSGGVRRTQVTSSRWINQIPQSASISAPATAVQGTAYVVTGTFSPARPGRTTVLQRLVGSAWTTMAAGFESTVGRTVFTTSSAAAGPGLLRVVARTAGGAPEVGSAVARVDAVPPPDTVAPAVPTGLQATGHDGSVALAWSPVSPGADLAGYLVYRATSPAGPWARVTPAPVSAPAFEVGGLTNDLPYFFAVTSIDVSANESARSVVASAKPVAGPDTTPPPPPGDVLAVGGDSRIDLSWSPSAAGDVAGYTVYLSTDSPTGPWTKAAGGLVDTTGTTVTGLTNGTAYFLAVTATDTAGNESDRSATATSTPAVPAVIDRCGTLATDQSWSASSVQRLTCPVVVPAGITLTVEPGTVVKAAAGVGIAVSGVLHAAGVAGTPVSFTSLRDDLAGDTDADGTSSAPAAGDWDGISVSAGGFANLEATTLYYASTALKVADGGGASLHGAVLDSTTGVSANTYVDATHVDWGDPSGPWPIGAGTSIVGATIDALPWAGWVPPPLPAPTPAGTTPDAGGGCQQVLFLGVRGSGEAPFERSDDAAYASWLDGFGVRVGKVFDGFAAEMGAHGVNPANLEGVGVRYQALHPPALSNVAFANAPFTASVWEGVDRIDQYLADEYARCGTGQKYVLVGYSQGALAIHLYLTQRAPAYVLPLIAAVGLVADPARNAHGAEETYTDGFVPVLPGSWQRVASGTYAAAGLPGGGPLPVDVTGRTATMCHEHDVVCAPGPGASAGTHINYDMAGTEMADLGAWLARTAIDSGLPPR